VVSDPICPFCQIVADTNRCTLLAEDEATLAFMDIHPANDGHCLVISKPHFVTIFDIPTETFAAVGRMVVRIAGAVQHALRPAGLSLVQANGKVAHQTVPHVHVHVLPRRQGDGLLLNWPRTGEGDPAKIAAIAKRIRRHLPSGLR
jgi:histidine triad (HIT) family protein